MLFFSFNEVMLIPIWLYLLKLQKCFHFFVNLQIPVAFKQIKISFPNNKTESEKKKQNRIWGAKREYVDPWDKLDKDLEEITGDTGRRWRMANINWLPNVFVFPSCITRTKEVFVEWRHHHHNHGESNHMWKCFYELPIFFHQKL